MSQHRSATVAAAAPPPGGTAPVVELRAANAIPEQQILDAAYRLLLAVGLRRMTMADVARAAGVSRATLYRRWPNVRAIVGTLMTREFAALTAEVFAADAPDARGRLVNGVVAAVRRSREHPMVRKIIDLDPDFLLPYLFERRGGTTNAQLAATQAALRAGVADGSIRPGEIPARAAALLTMAWSFALTGPVMADDLDALDAELRELLERYLAP
jgi:AcrR family transcriptional regulator